MIAPELLALRQALYEAQSTFNQAQAAFWNGTPSAPAFEACEAAAVHLEAALTALITYLRTDAQHDAEQMRTQHLQSTLQRENALTQERARQAGLVAE